MNRNLDDKALILNLFRKMIIIRRHCEGNDSHVANISREQGSTLAMPYIPYWFESFGPFLPWVAPCISLAGLWIAQCSENLHVRRTAERFYFAAMLLVSWVALRTVLANDGCWIIHMASIGVMVLGATYPTSEHAVAEFENDFVFFDL